MRVEEGLRGIVTNEIDASIAQTLRSHVCTTHVLTQAQAFVARRDFFLSHAAIY